MGGVAQEQVQVLPAAPQRAGSEPVGAVVEVGVHEHADVGHLPRFEWEPPLAPGHAGLDLRPEHLGVPARRKGLAALPPVGLGPADLVDEAGDLASAVRPNQLEVMRAALRTLGETVSDMGRARSLPGSVGASNYSHTRLATLRVEPSSALGRHQ